MKISKKTVLVLWGMFSISALWLMFVSEDKNLYTDLNNAVQHIPQVKIISTWNTGEPVPLQQAWQ